MFGSKTVSPLDGDDGVDSPSLLQRIYELVIQLDRYLGPDKDAVTDEQVANTEQKVLRVLRLDGVDWQPAYSIDLDTTALYAVALLGVPRCVGQRADQKGAGLRPGHETDPARAACGRA